MIQTSKPQLSDISFLFFVNGEAKTQVDYELAYLVPAVGKKKAKPCMQMIQVLLIYVWLGVPASGEDAIGDGSTKAFVWLSDYRLRVFFEFCGSTCKVYDAVA